MAVFSIVVFIQDPTPREKLERNIIKPILSAKAKFGVHLYSTENEEKSCVVERWNRTMNKKMFTYFSANSTRKYIDILDEMVNQYNNTKHSSIKMNIVFLNLNGKVRSNIIKPKFSIDPPTYKITDHNSEEIHGTFYEQELQKTNQEIFRIEKVIRKQGNKSLLKWYGYPNTFKSWVDIKEL
ncbi:uncharacterized protein LOC136073512 [Hydra vulgaris]|uniref:uncharacterized protein LOC136073512 n=1 Tax=Hydra vulgaris TaxID=6087 RepID=UPI0032EA39DA